MKRMVLFFLIVFLLCTPNVTADDIEFSVDQTEYYFLTGQQAIIPLTMNNSYDEQIDGLLTYTITQTVNQGGSQYSSTNSQSQSFSVPKDNNTIQISFGKSDQPLTLSADLEFSFTNDDETRIVTLNDIIIHFVSNQSQMNNQQDPMQSSSEKITNAEPSQNNEQQPQTPQEKLQNNQMSQDSQALKEQIEQQLAEKQEQNEVFEENLFENTEFDQQHQELLDQGYNLSDKQLDAQSNDTGSFNFTYENEDGETASFQGNMQDGELTDYQKQTAEDRKEMLDTLNQSKQFQEYHQQLLEEGYNQTSIFYDQQGNKTTVELTYEDEQNKTATITAEFTDEKLDRVTLSKKDEINVLVWMIPLILSMGFIIFFVYYWYFRRENQQSESSKKIIKKPFDYNAEAKRLLLEAEHFYKHGEYKIAYGKAGQSLRLYLSYEHGLKKEITNDDILRFLKNKQHPYQEIKQCFDICSLVEFAKYNDTRNQFSQVYAMVESIISKA